MGQEAAPPDSYTYMGEPNLGVAVLGFRYPLLLPQIEVAGVNLGVAVFGFRYPLLPTLSRGHNVVPRRRVFRNFRYL